MLIGTVGFVGAGHGIAQLPVMLLTLCDQRVRVSVVHAYSFPRLDHLSHRLKNALRRAVGWFWFVFYRRSVSPSGALAILSLAIERIGYQNITLELDFLGVRRCIFLHWF